MVFSIYSEISSTESKSSGAHWNYDRKFYEFCVQLVHDIFLYSQNVKSSHVLKVRFEYDRYVVALKISESRKKTEKNCKFSLVILIVPDIQKFAQIYQ